MKITSVWSFVAFREWLEVRCAAPYTTANLGHKGHGFKAVYRQNKITISFGTQGRSGSLNDAKIEIIFDFYKTLGRQRHNAGQYSYDVFSAAPDMILTPFVPALIRDYECEMLERVICWS